MVKTIQSETEQGFMPVAFDPGSYIAQRSAKDDAFKAAYENVQDEFSALEELSDQDLHRTVLSRMGERSRAIEVDIDAMTETSECPLQKCAPPLK